MFGKNIKKIRSLHGMSQQEFAELFDLKRATLGAYEEDRSNPKLETVVKIANYFSIGIEDLLTKDLTINRLLRFNEDMISSSGSSKSQSFGSIPCITEEAKEEFIKQNTDANTISTNFLPGIHLPNVSGENKLAFVVDDLTMSGKPSGFLPKDIVIGERVAPADMATTGGQLVLVFAGKELYFRKMVYQGDKILLNAIHHGIDPVALGTAEIKALWRIVHIFRYSLPGADSELEQRLAQLENTIAALRQNPGW